MTRAAPAEKADALEGTGGPPPPPVYRVVRVIARLNVGGPAIHVLNLSAGLADQHPTLLVAGQVDETEADMGAQAAGRGVHLASLPELGRRIHVWQDLVAFVKLYRLLRSVRPQVVHTHTAKAGTLGRIAAAVTGVPVRVHTFHGHVMHGYFSPFRTRLVIGVERMLARLSTCIVTISESQARELVEDYRICPPERMRVIPLGFDLSRFRPERMAELRGQLRRELGAGDRPIVAMVGRLVPIKDHALFLEAAARLAAAGADCLFLIVGGGSEEGRLRQQVEALGLESRVRFLGWREDLDRIYADSDVVALTSRNEGTPVCLIEALAAGCAVVSTDVGGVRDVLEGGRLGLLVPPGDAGAFAAAVELLLHDPARRRELGRNGAQAVPDRFGIDRLLNETARLYDELLQREGLLPETAHHQT
jgi:glycosyltransferase involved in cell wall biosynthesis